MGCEESFITMKFIWHSYLVLSLGIYTHETPTETGLTCPSRHHGGMFGVDAATFQHAARYSAQTLCETERRGGQHAHLAHGGATLRMLL